jgi:hypothetical protein
MDHHNLAYSQDDYARKLVVTRGRNHLQRDSAFYSSDGMSCVCVTNFNEPKLAVNSRKKSSLSIPTICCNLSIATHGEKIIYKMH